MKPVAQPAGSSSVLRPHAEHEFAHELAALAAIDDRERPPNWRLSPWAVVTYVLGGTASNFNANANAVEYGVTGNRGFFTDASGVIRFAAGADADATGTPIGQ